MLPFLWFAIVLAIACSAALVIPFVELRAKAMQEDED